MHEKTTSHLFKKYGSIYDTPKDINFEDLISKYIVSTDRVISNLYNFSVPVYIEIISGMANILISDSADGALKLFGVHRNLEIKKEMYFNIIPLTDKVHYNLIIPFYYNLKVINHWFLPGLLPGW